MLRNSVLNILISKDGRNHGKEKTLVELFQEMQDQFLATHGRLYTPQEAAILTDEIGEKIKRGKVLHEN